MISKCNRYSFFCSFTRSSLSRTYLLIARDALSMITVNRIIRWLRFTTLTTRGKYFSSQSILLYTKVKFHRPDLKQIKPLHLGLVILFAFDNVSKIRHSSFLSFSTRYCCLFFFYRQTGLLWKLRIVKIGNSDPCCCCCLNRQNLRGSNQRYDMICINILYDEVCFQR